VLTPKQRELLIGARKLIEDGLTDYLCVALGRVDAGWDVALDAPNLSKDCNALRDYILGQIRGADGSWITTLNSWQTANGFETRTDHQVRLDRLQWIDWLLDDWISHDGGEQPASVTRVRFRDGSEYSTDGEHLRWDCSDPLDMGHCVDIVSYKVLSC
jgi:hypothetical protein